LTKSIKTTIINILNLYIKRPVRFHRLSGFQKDQ